MVLLLRQLATSAQPIAVACASSGIRPRACGGAIALTLGIMGAACQALGPMFPLPGAFLIAGLAAFHGAASP